MVVAYEKSLVKDAPRAEADGHLSPEDEAALYAHYSQSLSGDVDVAPSDAGRSQPGGDADTTTGIDSDVAMTRSEEELDVNTRTQEAGRVRLRKWVETEDVTIRVPVRREKARLVTEPITDADDDAIVGGDLTSDEHEVVLREEVVDVEKRVVPKERVRLETEVETGEVVVDDEVRKERVEMDQDVDTQRDSS
ncbi:MAG: YsnF/AvaK domain-containing protein [Acidimicrobiia bacterium]|nr:YsnF/AvaK domain-containing protein [Acidimicrobiia bacterium]